MADTKRRFKNLSQHPPARVARRQLIMPFGRRWPANGAAHGERSRWCSAKTYAAQDGAERRVDTSRSTRCYIASDEPARRSWPERRTTSRWTGQACRHRRDGANVTRDSPRACGGVSLVHQRINVASMAGGPPRASKQ